MRHYSKGVFWIRIHTLLDREFDKMLLDESPAYRNDIVHITRVYSSMDRMLVSGTKDLGSTPSKPTSF